MNIVIAIIILSIIIIVHEFGHFSIAKLNGVAVNEFCLGLGPTILSTKFKGTVFSLKLLPFGGACIMAGEDGASADVPDDMLFSNKNVWQRISIIAAGPIFNFVLAFIMAMFIIGGIGYSPCVIYSVDENTSVHDAGLQAGDRITSVNGKKVVFYEDFSLYYNYHESDIMDITYIRDGVKHKTQVIPEYIEMDVYQMGISLLTDGTIGAVVSGSAAETAGLKVDDVIVGIGDTRVSTADEIIALTRQCEGETILVTVMRGSSELELPVTPIMTHYSYYDSGFVFSAEREKVGLFGTIKYSASQVRFWISTVFESLRLLFTGNVTKDDVAGPVGIVSAIGNVVEKSKSDGAYYVFLNLANWVVMISANLGVMNLLPIPALDGGRLIFLILEAIRRKPIDQKKEGIVHFVGMVLLMILMVFILFNDISNLFK